MIANSKNFSLKFNPVTLMSDAHHFTWEITQTYNLFTWQVEVVIMIYEQILCTNWQDNV